MVIICVFETKLAAKYPCDLFYPNTLIIKENVNIKTIHVLTVTNTGLCI